MKRIFLFIVSLLFFNLYAEDTGQISSENLSQDMEKKYDGLSSYYSTYINAPESQVVKARVIEIVYDDTRENRPDVPIESDFRYQHLKIKILTGKHRGEVYTIRNTIELAIPYKLIFKVNEKLILQLDEDETGKVNNLRIYERARDYKVYALIFIFAAVLIFVGKKKRSKGSYLPRAYHRPDIRNFSSPYSSRL